MAPGKKISLQKEGGTGETRAQRLYQWRKNRYFLLLFSLPLFFVGHNGVVDCLGEQKRPRGIPKKEEEEKKEVMARELCSRECPCFVVDPFVSD